MSLLLTKFKELEVNYPEVYRTSLFDKYANVGGANETTVQNSGKFFETYYEFYIYAFFIGLSLGHKTEINGKKNSFRVPISQWGRKSNKIHRTDFTKIQDFIFMAALTNSAIDPVEIELGNMSDDQALTILKETVEQFTNTGLIHLSLKLEEIKLEKSQFTFLNILLELNEASSAT